MMWTRTPIFVFCKINKYKYICLYFLQITIMKTSINILIIIIYISYRDKSFEDQQHSVGLSLTLSHKQHICSRQGALIILLVLNLDQQFFFEEKGSPNRWFGYTSF